LHFDISTFAGYDPRSADLGKAPAGRYSPSDLNPRQWARTAKEAGMTFAVLTAKHEAGFCMWDSADYTYDVASSPVKTDVVAVFVAACEAEGVLPGVHYSLPDARNEGAAKFKGTVSDAYFALIKRHMTELHTRYPQLRVQVFDVAARFSTEQATELYRLIKQCNPSCVIVGTDGPDLECDTVNQGWIWRADAPLNPASKLFNHYQRCQSANKAFLLNAGVNQAGVIPEATVVVLKELNRLITQSQSSAEAASARWTNSLGMVFVPVPGTDVKFSIWETRVRDFEKFVDATGRDMNPPMTDIPGAGSASAGSYTWRSPGFAQTGSHPVVGITWHDAQAFCAWLTSQEQLAGTLPRDQTYRLPTDAEWSRAIGLDEYPWGGSLPPPAKAGNYASEEFKQAVSNSKLVVITNYYDGFAFTAPVGSFAPNRHGLFDLSGNVWEWCEDVYRPEMNSAEARQKYRPFNDPGQTQKGNRVLRGASWFNEYTWIDMLRSSFHHVHEADARDSRGGFRVVLAKNNSTR
jgi:formylglycine-generating enzyme required for sulfatase activity